MNKRFLFTKILPVLAIIFIYWIGKFGLANAIFLPIALSTAVLVFYLANRFGASLDDKEK